MIASFCALSTLLFANSQNTPHILPELLVQSLLKHQLHCIEVTFL